MRLRLPFTSKQPLRLEQGRTAEQLARHFLIAHGYVIDATNVRFPIGEIDIVAREGRVLCFVEVRSASSLAWGGAAASITGRKRRHIIRAAEWFLAKRRPPEEEIRFDVVTVQWQVHGPPDITLLRGAFDAGDAG